MSTKKQRSALYPGSFDPVTNGHIGLIDRARQLFDKVHVAVAVNSEKKPFFTLEERIRLLKQALRGKKEVCVESFEGLMIEHARTHKIEIIIRGLRATSDFDYEFQMALTNRQLASDIDTIFLMPSEKNFYLSSRMVKEIARLGGDVSRFVPPFVQHALLKRCGKQEQQNK